jgi:hypothetical protein
MASGSPTMGNWSQGSVTVKSDSVMPSRASSFTGSSSKNRRPVA